MTAAACCTSTPIIYQIQIISTKSQRSQFTPIITRTSLPTSNGSIISISEIRRPIKLKDTIKNDLNNNKNDHEVTKISNQEARDLTSNDDTPTNINEEDFLALVGLRRKTKISSKRPPTLRPLAKRLAAPVCLLPLPKYGQRVRQALNILLPFLKFLSIIQDIELFCSTNDHARNECLLTRSVTQTRTSKPMSKKANKRKVSKSEFITMAAYTFRNNTSKTPMSQYVHSTLQCNVIIDRLEHSAIDQIMKNAIEDNQNSTTSTSNIKRSLRSSSQQESSSSLNIGQSSNQTTTKTITTRTTITTTTTEKTTFKHNSSTTSYNNSKRFKPSTEKDSNNTTDTKQVTLSYKRIYLKCFVCSKRESIDAQATNSDILHSHWLEHGNDLSLNIYDSIIDSILTRVVEFFYFPKQHSLEGKIQNVFILNSREIRKTTSSTVDDDSCIILD